MRQENPSGGKDILLEVKNLKKYFQVKTGMLKKTNLKTPVPTKHQESASFIRNHFLFVSISPTVRKSALPYTLIHTISIAPKPAPLNCLTKTTNTPQSIAAAATRNGAAFFILSSFMRLLHCP